jgi:hypothetical protein
MEIDESLFDNFIIVVENFYTDPMEVRRYALHSYDYAKRYPYGNRTNTSYCKIEINQTIEKYMYPFGGSIRSHGNTSGSFLFTTPKNNGYWIHTDKSNTCNWAGVLYMNPNAPIECGTANYIYCDDIYNKKKENTLHNEGNITRNINKWRVLNRFGNVFNKLVLYRSDNYHTIYKHFGKDKYDCRVTQTMFYETEK